MVCAWELHEIVKSNAFKCIIKLEMEWGGKQLGLQQGQIIISIYLFSYLLVVCFSYLFSYFPKKSIRGEFAMQEHCNLLILSQLTSALVYTQNLSRSLMIHVTTPLHHDQGVFLKRVRQRWNLWFSNSKWMNASWFFSFPFNTTTRHHCPCTKLLNWYCRAISLIQVISFQSVKWFVQLPGLPKCATWSYSPAILSYAVKYRKTPTTRVCPRNNCKINSD